MINSLKKKIFWIIQLSLSIIILGVIILFTTMSYRSTLLSSNMFMERLEGNGYVIFDEFKEDKFDREFSPIKIDGVYRIQLNSDSTVIKESDEITDEIREYAIKASNKMADEGFVGKYIYKVRKFGNGNEEITLVENESAVKRLYTILFSAIIIGVVGLFSIYLIAKKIAIIIVKPVEQSFEKQKQFVSDASHELKTPLAVIEANSDVLQNKIGDNKWLTYIQNEVQSMNKLVNDLLTLSKTEDIQSTNIQKFNLSKEVQMSVSVFESMIYEKKIKLDLNVDEGIEFNGDKEDIKHIISIILDNAIKHTEEGNKIIVNAIKEKSDVKIEIRNQGKPIPEEDQEKIFERFYRVDKSRNRNEKRYGLGLSIAKSIVDKYNGTIKAESKDGFTTFEVKLNNK